MALKRKMETPEEIRSTPAWRNNTNVQHTYAGNLRIIAGEIAPILGTSAAE